MVDFMQMKAFAEDPLIWTEGDGIWLTDIDGKRYIDGLSGTFCLSLGHNNQALVEAGQPATRFAWPWPPRPWGRATAPLSSRSSSWTSLPRNTRP